MEFLIEFVVEFFFEIVIDGGMEMLPNSRVPKWLRCVLAVLITLFFAVIIFGCIILGILIMRDTIPGGLVILAIGLILLVGGIRKFIKIKNQITGEL